jgi:tRNA-(ms[2]io[6]A)-hydroxylase
MSEFLTLKTPTPSGWLERAAVDIDTLVLDHANCEKKAASTALGLIFAYADDAPMCHTLARLAREELRHFEQVSRLMRAQKIAYRRLSPGRYASELRKGVAVPEPQRKLDLLLLGAIIEARSAERFEALLPIVPQSIAEFYETLAEAERRHIGVYEIEAKRCAEELGLDWRERLEGFLVKEADLIESLDSTFRFHSGRPV